VVLKCKAASEHVENHIAIVVTDHDYATAQLFLLQVPAADSPPPVTLHTE